MTDWWPIALVALLLLVAVGGWLLWRASTTAKERGARSGTAAASSPGGGGHTGDQGETAPSEATTETLPRAAIVVNPTKFDGTDKVRKDLSKVCREHGWADPLWLETTQEDPGYGQTKQALAKGVDLVCALGGDGTVRIVGSAMVGSSGVPMGLLSGGTGNLLARNLALPVTSLTQGMTVALTGQDHRIDTATLRLRRPLHDAEDEDAPPPVDTSDLDDLPPVPSQGEGEVEDHIFLVMAGIGFDAEVMANAPEKLKKHMGWAAYIVSGAQRLKGKQFKVDVRTDDVRLRRRVRSVIISNVGKLTGGLNLVPQAEADDGILDLVLLSPEGLVGWGAVVTRLVTRSSRGHQRVDYYTGRTIEVTSGEPVEIQLDGDTLGLATAMTIGVNPGSLILRRPRDDR